MSTPTAEFKKWATGFSGCDGGNLRGSVWFCGIEWGTGEKHDLVTEFKSPVNEPPQLYDDPSKNLKYPFNIKAMKLISAIRGGSVSDYQRVAQETPFPFHRDSDFFKLNLFPVAFREVDHRLWDDKYRLATGLPTRDAYLEWCRTNRFPEMRGWMKEGKPKLVVGVGISFKDDFMLAFGSSGTAHEESLGGARLVWASANEGKTHLAVIPFLGHQRGCLNSDQLLQSFGERLGQFLTMRGGESA